MSKIILSTDNLKKNYLSKNKPLKVLKGISIKIKKGDLKKNGAVMSTAEPILRS